MSDILSLAPQNVWKHFYSLTQVPRPSGHLEKIQAFLLEFGKSVGVESFQDEAGNIIYRKPATPGMENRKAVILQAHMDMVPQKNKDTEHDFEKTRFRHTWKTVGCVPKVRRWVLMTVWGWLLSWRLWKTKP